MKSDGYNILINEVANNILKGLSLKDRKYFENYFNKVINIIVNNKNETPKKVFDLICEDYLKSVQAISKLSPGLMTGIKDDRYGITLNTISGKTSDIPNAPYIDESTVFDASSMTKMFTAILVLKEAEEGRIDLRKKFSDYNSILKGMDITIEDALKFGSIIKTNGRVDEKGLSKNERIKRLLNAYVLPGKYYQYNDIPYMLVPLLFDEDIEKASLIYLKKFYKLYRGIGLKKTGYSTINFSGGNVVIDGGYKGLEIFDPKACIFEKEVGYVPAHAGVTTNIEDLEKLFTALNNGLLSEKSIETLITTIEPDSQYLLDEKGMFVLKNGNKIRVNHAMGVFAHVGDVSFCNIARGFSKNAFAAQGSTGTCFTFDIDNGISCGFLSNVRSGLYSKLIDTENYKYGSPIKKIEKNKKTTVYLGSASLIKGSMEDGKINDGDYKVPYIRLTDNFKEEQFKTIMALRIAKLSLIIKAKLEKNEQILKEIDKIFNSKEFIRVNLKDKTLNRVF